MQSYDHFHVCSNIKLRFITLFSNISMASFTLLFYMIFTRRGLIEHRILANYQFIEAFINRTYGVAELASTPIRIEIGWHDVKVPKPDSFRQILSIS